MLAFPANLFPKYLREVFSNAEAAWYNCNFAIIVTLLQYLQICHL